MKSHDETVNDLFEKAITGERRSIGRLLSVIEQGGDQADSVTEMAHTYTGKAHIVGITGAPGSGKSTLTGQLTRISSEAGWKTAVLAVDPSSPLTGGAILGDRIRMDDLAGEETFIRSMATRGHSGGLALAVPAAIRLFDAVGYDPVIIETVGVGQVEVDVAGTADTTVVVVTPGWGDAVQANKAGLLEVADIFVVNKADRPGAKDARRDLELMLDLGHISGLNDKNEFRPPIIMTNALDGEGTNEVWKHIKEHGEHLHSSGQLEQRQSNRIHLEIMNRLNGVIGGIASSVLETEAGRELLKSVTSLEVSPSEAAKQLAATVLK